ncbi:glycosyltransferase [Porcipelethomonas sp.]|uniref:glycosyltransferase n=1 Tax=Porcipelethomonas sp. TaxID=2981675 RepID=UPI003EF29538
MNKYSVLMSVYKKESAQNLRESVDSMMNQTIPPDDFVLYCDGVLTDELYREIERLKLKYSVLNVVYSDVALGLGKALNNAIGYCKNDIIARMDSDDIARPDRMEYQLEAFIKYSADIVSAEVEEFVNSTNNIISVKTLPETDEEIKSYSKRRNPFNHPCTCFRKHQVYMAGGYQDCPFFEDYYLWIRMLSSGCRGYNIQKPLLYMRSGKSMYMRRGGLKYTSHALKFRSIMYKMHYCSFVDFIFSCCGHILMGLMPGRLRMKMYSGILRK